MFYIRTYIVLYLLQWIDTVSSELIKLKRRISNHTGYYFLAETIEAHLLFRLDNLSFIVPHLSITRPHFAEAACDLG